MTENIPPSDAGAMDLVLTCIRMAARDTNLYSFARADRGPLPSAEPGAHIGVILPNGIERQYSLVQAAPQLSEYTVGVKRDANSRGGSLFMHDQLRVGSSLKILPPRNNFPLKEDADHVVLMAGGIGITPIYCMLKRLMEKGRSWELYYSCRSRLDTAFLDELSRHAQAHFHFDDEEAGRFLNVAGIVEKLPKNASRQQTSSTFSADTSAAASALRQTIGVPAMRRPTTSLVNTTIVATQIASTTPRTRETR